MKEDTVATIKNIRITEKHNGRWHIDLDEDAMRALVSMVRLSIGSGEWAETLLHSDGTAEAAHRLFDALNRHW
jgi:hypothetical protein